MLEFCQVPRSGREVYNRLGLKAHAHTPRTYIKPLLEAGKLLLKFPDCPNSNLQRYVAAGFESLIVSRGNILDFCKTPQRKRDISEHFGISCFQTSRHVEPLLMSGELAEVNPRIGNSSWQRYIRVEEGMPVSIDEIILAFCQEPRSRKEIAAYLKIDVKRDLFKYIDPLMESGKLKMTKPEHPTSVEQRFFTDGTSAVVFTTEKLIEFCSIPRTRDEIAKRFHMQQYTAAIYVRELIQSGRLKYTVPMIPSSRYQKFVVPDYEIVVCDEKTLLDFCATPRTIYEIMGYFGHANSKVAMSCRLMRFIKLGKLAYTIPELPRHKWQKYIAVA